jgi:hypothetical protein
VICQDQGYHMLLHRRARALRECGDASARRCVLCGKYDRQHDIALYKRSDRAGGSRSTHRSCNRARVASRQTKVG